MASSFYYIFICSISSFLVCLIGCIISWIFQGPTIAKELFYSYIVHFNGILVAGFGYGLMFYIQRKGKNIITILTNVIFLPDKVELVKITSFLNKASSMKWGYVISIPITIIGGTILLRCGYPLSGFARFWLAVCSISLYFVAGTMLSFFIYSLIAFHKIENMINVSMIKSSFIEFETLISFFTLTSTLGIFALYFAFRGTLTANFINVSNEIRQFLLFPILLFAPAPLFYSFYPKSILKKIYENEIIFRIKKIENKNRQTDIDENTSMKERLEMEKLLLDIKDRLLIERNKYSVFGLKDSPSIFIILLMIIQFILQNDRIIVAFKKLF